MAPLQFRLIDKVLIYLHRDLAMVYTNENWYVILLSQIYFGDLVTKIYYFSPQNSKYSAQLRTISVILWPCFAVWTNKKVHLFEGGIKWTMETLQREKNFLWYEGEGVVYFDQRLGAAHSAHGENFASKVNE